MIFRTYSQENNYLILICPIIKTSISSLVSDVLCMPDDRFPRQALFAETSSSWKRPSGVQHMTWQRNMKSSTEGLSCIGNVRLVGWGRRDPFHLCLEMIWHLLVVCGVPVLSLLPFLLRDTLTTYLSLNFSHLFRM